MKLFFYILTLLIVNVCYAQNDVLYNNFTATKIDNVIRIDFTLVAGSTCNGIHLERGSDSFFFNEIGSISGQCGSPTDPIFYTFIDDSPILNSFNYYRLNFGGANISNFIAIYYVSLTPKVVTVSPNPSNGYFTLSFENKLAETLNIEIISNNGIKVYSTTSNTEKKQIELPLIPKGIYFVRVYNENFISLISKGIINIL